MCQTLTVPGAGDAAMRKNSEVHALKGTRAVYVNYHCQHGLPPILNVLLKYCDF